MSKMQKPAAFSPDDRNQPLYADRVRVYPQAVTGKVRRAKWAVLGFCLGLYYLLPWMRWDRGPGQPDQAVLVDMDKGRLFFFPIEVWPQEVYYLTGLLLLGALGIFAATSLFGRVWCGFACPQTVWTDLYMLVERWIEGDRNARMRRDAKPRWSAGDWGLKLAKHAAWILIAAATGGAWVMYFTDAPTLLRDLLHFDVSPSILGFAGLFTLSTYLLAGWAREQVCTYMCPWPRFQSAMLDDDSLAVSYRAWRGEPRGKARDTSAGDCIDCRACVNVCPTGVDIREGLQMACINCGLCIDACDGIMTKLGRPTALVAFETVGNLAAATAATAAIPPGPARCAPGMAARRPARLLRPRTWFYAAAMSVIGAVMIGAFAGRTDVGIEALRDRAPLFVRLADGSVRNSYTLKISDRRASVERLAIGVEGLPGGASWGVLNGGEPDAAGRPTIETRADGVAEARLFITTAPQGRPEEESTPIRIRLLQPGSDTERAAVGTVFLRPRS
ncbi:cytochrome c oxidase accessory protein CcoG [Roseomonas sp. KE2513]|uniref:cytochrome c oxidase accessory protein CcoG n=1 Tax=Roseomonas sp. KE2513 TaxID=2479202 RepID=UPI0018DF8A0E|nr:cytochrome c oxidase accessory protein CcoG [Roseomonas sp. KE2513]MBI0537503.1 cytochrome c oxidase accessory protein CcoG [Roseomonas sp. KE2513]